MSSLSLPSDSSVLIHSGATWRLMRRSHSVSFDAVVLLGAMAWGMACSSASAQTNEWTWMGGSSTLLAPSIGYCASGNYGTLGIPSSGNYPSPREADAAWTDTSGNRWLFGGYGCFYWMFNDLWKFDVSANEWVWISGSDTPNQNGLYGTLGTPAAGNVPSARINSSSWTDQNGNFWLFGGVGGSGNDVFGILNDLWEFNPSISEWTWVAGSNVLPVSCARGSSQCGIYGVYGTLGTGSATTSPGSRVLATTWKDKNGNLWFFGGYGYDSTGGYGYLNDFWQFNVANRVWTWMGGSSTCQGNGYTSCFEPGIYGTKGTPAAGNIPGARYETVSWTDVDGNFWLYGGSGADSAGNIGTLNDLWQYNVSLGQWAWMGGNTTVPPGCVGNGCDNGWPAVYGTLSVPASANWPGGRLSATGWTDSFGNLWFFGGSGPGWGTGEPYPYLNDLWEFHPSTGEWAWMGGSNIVGQAGSYGNLGSASPANIPGARLESVEWNDSSGNIWLFGGFGFDSMGNTGVLNDLWRYQLPAPPNFTLSASPTSLSLNSGSQGNATLTVTPQNGFNSTVSFACSGLPANATCSFNPKTVTPSAAAVTTQLTIAISAQASVVRSGSHPFLPATGFALAASLIVWKRRRVLGGALLVVLLAGAMPLPGCGGGGTGSGRGGGGSPQSYTVTVTATSGTLQQTATVTLVEN